MPAGTYFFPQSAFAITHTTLSGGAKFVNERRN